MERDRCPGGEQFRHSRRADAPRGSHVGFAMKNLVILGEGIAAGLLAAVHVSRCCGEWENDLKREAVATQAEESRVAIAGSFDAGEELMGGVGATVGMAGGVVLVLLRHSGTRGFAKIERCSVTAKYFHGRPFGQHGDRRRCVRREFLRGVDNFAADDREHRLDAFDFFFWHGEVVIGERNQVGELTNGDGALPATLT